MKLKDNLEIGNFNKIFGNGGKYAKWRIISILTVGVMALSAFFTGDFIYKNIYNTLSNANMIIVLSSNLGIDTVDIKNYNLAEERKKLKTESFSWGKEIRNIFIYESEDITTTTP